MQPSRSLTITERPRVYVACLAAYNSGKLHGAWIDAEQDAWALWQAVAEMLATSPEADAEEWAIHDHEGFGGLRIEEHIGLEALAELAAFVAEHGALGAALIDYTGSVEEAVAALRDGYVGSYASLADYVEELTEEATDVPASLRPYIDWNAMARDAELNGDLFTVRTAWDAVHVFAGH